MTIIRKKIIRIASESLMGLQIVQIPHERLRERKRKNAPEGLYENVLV